MGDDRRRAVTYHGVDEAEDELVQFGAASGGATPRRRRLLALLAVVAVAAALLYGLVSTTASASQLLSRGAAAARVDPGIVDITVIFGQQGGASGAGTGMVITSSGEVLTNNHVIDGATSVTATDLGNGRTYVAVVVGYSPSRDVALLQLQGAAGLRTVPLGDSAAVRIGRDVFAMGNAGGRGGTPSISAGKIGARNRSIIASDMSGANAQRLRGLFETTARVVPGDSGGPVVDRRSGGVIGMNAAASVLGPSQTPAAQSYAIPIDSALVVVHRIERGLGSATVHIGPTAQLGVGIATLDPYPVVTAGGAQLTGALIGAILPGSPAEGAGLREGDVVVELGGRRVASGARLRALLLPRHPGDSVEVRWIDQAGVQRAATVELASGPPA
jgi:S1-C subfamily serine protease